MTETTNTRQHLRFELFAQVQVTKNSDVYIMSTQNISLGGIFILGVPEEHPDLREHTAVELEIFGGDDPDSASVNLQAIVIHVKRDPPSGFGLMFINLTPDRYDELTRFMETVQRVPPSDSRSSDPR